MRPETFTHTADVDPELERQLAQAAADEPIEALFLLGQQDEAPPTRASVTALLKRGCRGEDSSGVESTYLPRMGTLIVRACPQIIRRLIAQPEVEIACANRGELLVTPSTSSQAAL
jgi:hypothetical protein